VTGEDGTVAPAPPVTDEAGRTGPAPRRPPTVTSVNGVGRFVPGA
jgi:hypothetical protein